MACSLNSSKGQTSRKAGTQSQGPQQQLIAEAAWLPKGLTVCLDGKFDRPYEVRGILFLSETPAVRRQASYYETTPLDVSKRILVQSFLRFSALCREEPPQSGEYDMKSFAKKVQRFLKSEDGPTAVEYAVMLALIIIVCLTAITAVGTQAAAQFNNIAGQVGAI